MMTSRHPRNKKKRSSRYTRSLAKAIYHAYKVLLAEKEIRKLDFSYDVTERAGHLLNVSKATVESVLISGGDAYPFSKVSEIHLTRQLATCIEHACIVLKKEKKEKIRRFVYSAIKRTGHLLNVSESAVQKVLALGVDAYPPDNVPATRQRESLVQPVDVKSVKVTYIAFVVKNKSRPTYRQLLAMLKEKNLWHFGMSTLFRTIQHQIRGRTCTRTDDTVIGENLEIIPQR